MKAKTHDMTKGVYRKVYAGYLAGRRICSVSLDAEAWFWRLHAIADDYGNFPGDPILYIKAASGRRDISRRKGAAMFDELVRAGLVATYEANGEPLGHICGFTAAQPAGKNGSRIRRHPESPHERDDWRFFQAPKRPEESEGIRGNPKSPGKSCASDADADAEFDTDTEDQTPPHPAPRENSGSADLRASSGGEGAQGGIADPRRVQVALEDLGVKPPKATALARLGDVTVEEVAEVWRLVESDAHAIDKPSVLVWRLLNRRGLTTKRETLDPELRSVVAALEQARRQHKHNKAAALRLNRSGAA